MARLAVGSDSEAEFPDVRDLLKGVRSSRSGPTSTSTSISTASKSVPASKARSKATLEPESRDGGKVKAVRKAVRKEERFESVDVGGDGQALELEIPKAAEKSGKKKRVLILGRRDDNPLLRPIGRLAREERVRGPTVALDAGKIVGKRRVRAASVTSKEEVREVNDDDARSMEPSPMDFSTRSRQRKEIKVKSTELETSEPQGYDQRSAGIEVPEQVDSVFSTVTNSSRGVDESTRELHEEHGVMNRMSGGGEGDEDHDSDEGAGKDVNEEDDGEDEALSGLQLRASTSREKKSKAISTVISLDSDDESVGVQGESEALPKTNPQESRKHRIPPPKTKSKFILTDTEEEDSPEEEGSDGMSDFIVSDNEPLEDDDDSVFEVPPPATRSARKLFRGRRPKVEDSDDGELDLKMGKTRIDDENVFGAVGSKKKSHEEHGVSGKTRPTTSSKLQTRNEGTMDPPPETKKRDPVSSSSDIEDPFTLRFSPYENKRKVSKETHFTTPPGTPKLKPRILPSPSKLLRIPTSPHRQSSDAFWAQDVVNDWNDSYSPRKTPAPTLKPITTADGTLLFSPRKSPVKPDRLTKDSKKAFSQIKHELAESFLKELDEKITSGRIAEMATSTGGVKMIWSKKLNTTAGRANWKRETIRPKTSNPAQPPPAPTFRHHAAIELAEKVIDDQDRLLNVIAHEFCHLANFMISNICTNPHGKEFKAWASKVSSSFKDRGIEVTTKHSYEIEYKYIWECENCGTEFKRHSKSIDVVKHRCGVCKSLLVQTRPVPRAGGKEGGLTGYQAFVKENMKKIKEENPGSPQKIIMGLVGKRYQEFKASQFREGSVESGSGVVSKEGTPDDDVGDVVRKLDFLDLTSP